MNGHIRFSVIICTYSMERFPDFVEAIESVVLQTYPNVEIVVVVDGNKPLYDIIMKENLHDVIHLNETNLGLSKSRTIGTQIATGDVVAFLDDDAVADKFWIVHLADMYISYSAVAAGGKLEPKWVDGVSNFIPEEFWWLIGATPKGSSEQIIEVRNTYGSNISFARDVFLKVGGFNSDFGFNVGKNRILQGEEADICNRIKQLTDASVWYTPYAIVYHKVFKSRVGLVPLFRRAFWQGYSKRVMKESAPDSLGQEYEFLNYILFVGIPERVKGLFSRNVVPNVVQLFFLLAFTNAVGLGYIYRVVNKS